MLEILLQIFVSSLVKINSTQVLTFQSVLLFDTKREEGSCYQSRIQQEFGTGIPV